MGLNRGNRSFNGKIFFMIMAVFYHAGVIAQQDNEFWFVAPEVSASHADQPIKMIFATRDSEANVEITQPANPGFAPITFTVPPNSTYSQDLTSRKSIIENNPADQVNPYGLYVHSDFPVSCYYEVAASNNPDIYPLKGINSLGMEFMVPSQDDFKNQVGNERIDIVATKDNTKVYITPTDNVEGHAPNVEYSITLNKGESYCIKATNTTASRSLKGTVINSDKPIAVTISDDSIRPGGNTGGYDLIGDQLIPLNILAEEYIVVQGFADPQNEKVYILAIEDGTEIHLDGSPVISATLNKGEQYKFLLSTPSKYITSNHPIYVYHLSGHDDESGSALLPPIACTGSQDISFVRSSGGQFSMMVFTEQGNINSFEVNDNPSIIQGSDFAPITGTANAWWYARIDNPAIGVGGNNITNSSGKFHLGILNELGGSSEYGFFSAYASLNLGEDVLICEGSDYTFDAGEGMDSYLWSNDSTTRFITVEDTGYYWVHVVDDMCDLSDTIHLGFYPNPVPELGSDTAVCPQVAVTFNPGSFRDYIWSDGSTNPDLTTDIAGEIWVKVIDENTCSATDTVELINFPVPAPLLIYHD